MKRLVGQLAVAALVAACATIPIPTGPATLPPALDPGHVLVAIDDASNWPGTAGVEDPRLITLTADGTLVVREPNGARLAITETRLDREALDAAWTSVIQSGAATNASLEVPGLYDASTSTIRIDDGSRRTELSVYALGGEPDAVALSAEDTRLRRVASALISELGLLAGSEPWEPPALLLWIDEPGDEGLPPRVVPWTPSVDLASAGGPIDNPFYDRCVRLEGRDATDVADFVRGLPSDVLVEQGGTSYGIAVRPIYPDELDEVACP